jgi:hypothetical protein
MYSRHDFYDGIMNGVGSKVVVCLSMLFTVFQEST